VEGERNVIFLKNITGSCRKTVLMTALTLVLGLCATGAVQAQTGKPNLYLVSAGISNYIDIPALKCAHKDAMDVTGFFRAQEGKLFNRVEAITLTNNQATLSAVHQSMLSLQGKPGNDDYTIIFLAGHGGKGPHPEYAYCAFDKDLTWTQIQGALRGLPGKIIVILDTCEAGAITNTGNIIVFSSSLAHQGADEEQNPMGNGFFTKSLIEALSGKADMDGNGVITLAEVDAYVSSRVEQISFGKQSTTLVRPVNIPSTLPLAKLFPAQPVTPVYTPPVPTFNGTSSGPIAQVNMGQPR
jgi:uncharacterized caspase-like protein